MIAQRDVLSVQPTRDVGHLLVALEAAERQRSLAWRAVNAVAAANYRTHRLRKTAEYRARHAAHLAEAGVYAALLAVESHDAEPVVCAHERRLVSDPELGLLCARCAAARHGFDVRPLDAGDVLGLAVVGGER